MIKRIVFIGLLMGAAMAATADNPRRMQYYPDGKEIVCVNGNNRYTRALYGSYTDFRIETSDRPIFGIYKGKMPRNVRFVATIGGKERPLEEMARCEARYHAGKRSYTLTDTALGKGKMNITVLAMPDTETAIWRFETTASGSDITMKGVVCGIRKPQLARGGDMNANPKDSFDPAADENSRQTVRWRMGKEPVYVVLTANEQGEYSFATLTATMGKALWKKAWRHHEWLAGRIVFDTPDAYINTLGGALTAAADGCWSGEVWLHGAVAWRMPLNGWRAGYLGDVMGWHERARSHFSAYAESQVTDVAPTMAHPTQDPDKAMARALKKWGTQMYSEGYICRNPHRNDQMHHYDMNLNYIDELLWHFEYDADTAYMRRMWPVIKRHLAWEKRNFDPDDDGLYDAYCCIWASDALYYNSGAVTHSSAYNYRGFRMAAKIAKLLGEDPAYYQAEADKTLRAMNERLWIKDRGHWAEYQDRMGLQRLHEDAALWTIYTPIDCGAATQEQAYRATQYVDNSIPHIPVVAEGMPKQTKPLYTLSTTDWQPYDWSINNVAAAEVMHTALAYFEAGRHEEGFQLIKANVMDQMYMGDSPGNYGQVSYYDKVRGELYRDFSDNCGISARALLQGLFGIIPNALDGRCILQPGFPEEWEHAAVTTPYLKYSFRREGNKEIYEVEQHFRQPLQIIIRRNTGYGYVETAGTMAGKQTIIIERPQRQTPPQPLVTADSRDARQWGNGFEEVKAAQLETVPIEGAFNSRVSDIFKNKYLSPRSPYTTLEIPVQGIGEWCHPEAMATIDEGYLQQTATGGVLTVGIGEGIPFRFPQQGRNIVYTSLWDNYPDSISMPLEGRASHAYLLMAGSTNHMQYGIDNGMIRVTYTDGTEDCLPLRNPHNWCPIEQDYYDDGLAFRLMQPRPYRIDFATGRVSRALIPSEERYGQRDATAAGALVSNRNFERGAGIILDMPLDREKTLKSITLRTLSNDVVIGLMGITLQRE